MLFKFSAVKLEYVKLFIRTFSTFRRMPVALVALATHTVSAVLFAHVVSTAAAWFRAIHTPHAGIALTAS